MRVLVANVAAAEGLYAQASSEALQGAKSVLDY